MNDSLPKDTANPLVISPAKTSPKRIIIVVLILGFLFGILAGAIYWFAGQNFLFNNRFSLSKPAVVAQDLKKLSSLTPEQRQAVQNGFEKDWNAADTEMKKLGAYYKVYTSLWAGYNVTKDPAVRAEMKKIQEFMASQLEWRQEYKLLTTGGGTFLDEK